MPTKGRARPGMPTCAPAEAPRTAIPLAGSGQAASGQSGAGRAFSRAQFPRPKRRFALGPADDGSIGRGRAPTSSTQSDRTLAGLFEAGATAALGSARSVLRTLERAKRAADRRRERRHRVGLLQPAARSGFVGARVRVRVGMGRGEGRSVVAFFVTTALTIVSVSVTFRQILARRGTPFARALSKDGASAVPAGGGYALRSRADPGSRLRYVAPDGC